MFSFIFEVRFTGAWTWIGAALIGLGICIIILAIIATFREALPDGEGPAEIATTYGFVGVVFLIFGFASLAFALAS